MPGVYFGVPLSNFLGWLLVGLLILKVYQWVDRALERAGLLPVHAPLHYGWRALLGPALYLGVLLFNLGVTFFLGATSEGAEGERFLLLGVVGCFIFVPVTTLLVVGIFDPTRRATPREIEVHIEDFPDTVLGHLGGGMSR
jgi:putative membrane protein